MGISSNEHAYTLQKSLLRPALIHMTRFVPIDSLIEIRDLYAGGKSISTELYF